MEQGVTNIAVRAVGAPGLDVKTTRDHQHRQASVFSSKSHDLYVWVVWRGEASALRRAAASAAALEQHTLIAAEVCEGLGGKPDGLFVLSFEYVGRSPEQERQTQGLLRRLAAVARWVKIERGGADQWRFDDADDIGAAWDALGRRAMP